MVTNEHCSELDEIHVLEQININEFKLLHAQDQHDTLEVLLEVVSVSAMYMYTKSASEMASCMP